MFLPTLAASLIALILLLLIFKKQLDKPIEINNFEIKNLKNKTLSIISISHLLICTILLAVSSYINLDMWLITLVFCLSLTIVLFVFYLKNKDNNYILKVYKRLPYTLGVFVLSMFTIVLALDHYNVTKIFYDLFTNISSNKFVNTFVFGISSTLCDNIINNIPMSLFFTSILSNSSELNLLSVFATIIGSNIGAFLTPIGALAGMMWMNILKEQKVKFNFLDFTKYGIILTFPILFVSLLVLCLVI
jgi:arsenical pump membrane protein